MTATSCACADRQAVIDLLLDVAGALDESRWNDWIDCFAADALVDYSGAGGPVADPATVAGWLESTAGALDHVAHLVSNTRVEIGGDDASGTASYLAPIRGAAGESSSLTGGRYAFTARRGARSWRLTRLAATLDWAT